MSLRWLRKLKNSWWTERALEIQRLADLENIRDFFLLHIKLSIAQHTMTYLSQYSKDRQELLRDSEFINT